MRGLAEGRAAYGIECQVLLDHSRRRQVDRAWRTRELATRYAADGVAGIGLSGDESFPLRLFIGIFEVAPHAGLHPGAPRGRAERFAQHPGGDHDRPPGTAGAASWCSSWRSAGRTWRQHWSWSTRRMHVGAALNVGPHPGADHRDAAAPEREPKGERGAILRSPGGIPRHREAVFGQVKCSPGHSGARPGSQRISLTRKRPQVQILYRPRETAGQRPSLPPGRDGRGLPVHPAYSVPSGHCER